MQWIYLGQYLSLADEMQRLMAVTLDDVKATMSQWAFQSAHVDALRALALDPHAHHS